MPRWTLWLLGSLALVGAGCAPSPHVHRSEPLQAEWSVAVLPLTNATESREAPDRLVPMIGLELSTLDHIAVIEQGRVEEALAQEPWLLTDRLPPDLVDSLGTRMEADALLVGSVLAYGYRITDGEQVPEVSLTLRLLGVPGGRVLWSVVHTRDGNDRETIFGFGRVRNLERLAQETVKEAMATVPHVAAAPGMRAAQKGDAP